MTVASTAQVATGIAVALGVLNIGIIGVSVGSAWRRRACRNTWFDPLTDSLRASIRIQADSFMRMEISQASPDDVVTADSLARATFAELGKSRPCVGAWALREVTTAVWPVLQAMAAVRLREIEG